MRGCRSYSYSLIPQAARRDRNHTDNRPTKNYHTSPHRAPTKADYIHFADMSGHTTRPVTQPTISGAFGAFGESVGFMSVLPRSHLHVIKLSRKSHERKCSRYGVGRGSLVTVTGSDVKLRSQRGCYGVCVALNGRFNCHVDPVTATI